MCASFISRCAIAAVSFAAALTVSVRAEDIGPDVAKRLLSEGRIRPLEQILDGVRAKVPGELLEVELELEDGIYVYDVKIMGADGRIVEVETDAKSGEILKVEDDD
ncbi:MAG: PepSY domain-containing protein [Hyphomicrobium sp.]|jgi:uncharacterized membrane protein YkoI